MSKIDKQHLDMILEWFTKSDLSSATVESNKDGSYKVKLSRAVEEKSQASVVSAHHHVSQTPVSNTIELEKTQVTQASNASTTEDTKNQKEIHSPIVGTFYRASNPDAPPFVQVGDIVKKGDTLCILEAMKVMNELEAEFDMEIVSILVETSTLVEYGQPLFSVIPV